MAWTTSLGFCGQLEIGLTVSGSTGSLAEEHAFGEVLRAVRSLLLDVIQGTIVNFRGPEQRRSSPADIGTRVSVAERPSSIATAASACPAPSVFVEEHRARPPLARDSGGRQIRPGQLSVQWFEPETEQ